MSHLVGDAGVCKGAGNMGVGAGPLVNSSVPLKWRWHPGQEVLAARWQLVMFSVLLSTFGHDFGEPY